MMTDISPLSRSSMRYRLAAVLSVLALGLLSAGCSTNPATGREDVVFMSQADEKKIGDENHPKILKQFGGAYNDPALQSYVNSLGQTLAATSELPNVRWTFTLLDSDVTNAFALPGGYVYVTRGLLSLAENEAQLAAVIGHEIGHVTARHGAQRQAQGTLAGIGVVGAQILGTIFGGAQVGRAAGQVAGLGAQSYVASYSRSQEYQADTLGIRYSGRVGFEPDGMAGFLAKLNSEKQLIAKLRGQAPRGSSYLDTHPPTEERVARARNLAGKVHISNPIQGRDIFLTKIDGMIWGDSPDQGYARDGVFSHEKLNIRYQVPDSFTLFNSARNVQAFGPNGAIIVFDGGPKHYGGSMRDYIRQSWVKNGRVSGLEAIKINGLEAATATTRGNINGKTMDVRLIAIRGNKGDTFRLQFLTPTSVTGKFREDFRRTTYSFRHMTSRERANLGPLRIRLHRVRPGDTVTRIANSMAVKKFALERFMLLNGVSQTTPLQSGSYVKVISDR